MSNEKMVPVSEVIRYRERTQEAEALVDTLRKLAHGPNDGVSLRDHFAGQIVSGILANETIRITGDGHPADEIDIAKTAYVMADAMLVERERIKP